VTGGKNSFPITDENVTLPPGIILKGVKPPVVEVTLGIPVVRELPVQVDWAGKLPRHLVLESVKIEPNKVRVIGGKRILDNISSIYTDKIYLDNIYYSGTKNIRIALSPPSLKIAPDSSETVTVEYVVRKR
jgi:YbbR domain-containing protein